MEIIEHVLSEPCEGVLVEPPGGSPVGVLVLAGSSGRIDAERCRVLARAGMTALAVRWFGGEGQPAEICEIPLETFVAAIFVRYDEDWAPAVAAGAPIACRTLYGLPRQTLAEAAREAAIPVEQSAARWYSSRAGTTRCGRRSISRRSWPYAVRRWDDQPGS